MTLESQNHSIRATIAPDDNNAPEYSVSDAIVTHFAITYAFAVACDSTLDPTGAIHNYQADTDAKDFILRAVALYGAKHGAAQQQKLGTQDALTELVLRPNNIATSSEFFALQANAMIAAEPPFTVEQMRFTQVSAAIFGVITADLSAVHVLPRVAPYIEQGGEVDLTSETTHDLLGDVDMRVQLCSELSLAAQGQKIPASTLRKALRTLKHLQRTTSSRTMGTA